MVSSAPGEAANILPAGTVLPREDAVPVNGKEASVSGSETLTVDPASGVVAAARQIPSPNCDDRPDPDDVSLIVVHGISLPPGEFGGPWVLDLFTNCLDPRRHPYFEGLQGVHVSAHLFIRRDGELIQFVPLHRRAWHAGQSEFRGRHRCNDFSVGIELEGTDEQPYTASQYRRLAALCRALMAAYPAITPERITGHRDIAPGRKTDPGPYFDWPWLVASVNDGAERVG
ncbi:1,6-anhydro-N-acetylmuramyl-L-alanine amidase AmpD [Ectothiorhodospiraceae bacterium WFHF3C12]|nr:1,6-anhydro-N-acetylmuramyl-L-alanine amidase AmpD [Ectothiorhodospiraceae bacterium WFHF3C12]